LLEFARSEYKTGTAFSAAAYTGLLFLRRLLTSGCSHNLGYAAKFEAVPFIIFRHVYRR